MSVLVRKSSLIDIFPNKSSFLFKSDISFSHGFSTSTEKYQPCTDSLLFLQKHHFSPQAASRISSVLNRVKNPQIPISVLSFLKENGFSETQLEKIIISSPPLLLASLENTIIPKFKLFQDLGFSTSEISTMLTKDPWFLRSSLINRLAPSLSVLNSLLGSKEEVAKLLRASGWFLSKDLEKTLVPNIEFLMSCGVKLNQILKFIYSFPRFFLTKPETMRKYVDKADRIGADRNSGMYLQAVRVIASMSEDTWELKWQAFRDLGFSDEDILAIYKKAPQVLVVSVEKMTKIKEILLATGKYEMSCIVKRPKSLTTSVEKRYLPRLQMLKLLESENLIIEWPNLGALYLLPDDKFHQRFIAPYINQTSHLNMIGTKSRQI